jgi:hypothetical protein
VPLTIAWPPDPCPYQPVLHRSRKDAGPRRRGTKTVPLARGMPAVPDVRSGTRRGPQVPPRDAGEQRPGDNAVRRIERPAPIPLRPIGLPILEPPASLDPRDVLAPAELCATERPGHVGRGKSAGACQPGAAGGSSCERKGRSPVEVRLIRRFCTAADLPKPGGRGGT